MVRCASLGFPLRSLCHPQPSIPANPVDSKLFWTALYAYPVGWAVLFFVSLLKFSVSYVQPSSVIQCCTAPRLLNPSFPHAASSHRYLPIVGLALVFNLSNVLGFTCTTPSCSRSKPLLTNPQF